MKSFVVLSYYQLLHSIAMTLEFGEKTNLYFCVNHLGIDEDFLSRIRETDVFNSVVKIDHSPVNAPMREELKDTEGLSQDKIDSIGDSIFEKYLTPFYSEIFKDADHSDEIYIYNDFQLHYYYIANNFENIIGVEDGYAGLERHINVINRSGIEKFNHGRYKTPFIGKYWPLMQWKSDKVKTVITSCELTEEAPDYLKAKAKVIDYFDLVKRHETEHRKAVEIIFDCTIPSFKGNSSLLLTQPLSRNGYCNSLEDFLFHRKLIREELDKADTVYVKPHPADRTDYSILSDDRVIVLERGFPVELITYEQTAFKRVISFMSTIADQIHAEEHVRVVENKDTDQDSISKCIRENIKGEKAELDYYVRVSEMTPSSYVNIYLLPTKQEYIDVKINVLLDRDSEIDPTYFEIGNSKEVISRYFKELELKKEHRVWAEKISRIPDMDKKMLSMIVFVEDADCTDSGVASLIAASEGDFAFVCDSKNPGEELRRDTIHILKNESIGSVRGFQTYTLIGGTRRYLGYGITGDHFTNDLANRLVSSAFISRLLHKDPDIFNGYRIVCDPKGSVAFNPSRTYYADKKHTCAAYDLEEEMLPLLEKEQDPEALACLITEVILRGRAKNLSYRQIEEEILDRNEKEDAVFAGSVKAVSKSLEYQERERNRFIFREESVYRYAKNEIDELMRDGTFEKMKVSKARKNKLKRITRRK